MGWTGWAYICISGPNLSISILISIWPVLEISISIRENFKYYFADFVRKGGGGGTPQIRNSLFAENFVRKGGGGTPLTDKICKVVFDVAPNIQLILLNYDRMQCLADSCIHCIA